MKPERIQAELTESLPHWESHPERQAIRRTYLFPDARPAMAFAQLVNETCLAQNRHAEILIRASAVTLTLPLDDRPLSEADFELARLIDRRGSG